MSVEEIYINERLIHLGIVAGVSQEIGSESHANALAVLMSPKPLVDAGQSAARNRRPNKTVRVYS